MTNIIALISLVGLFYGFGLIVNTILKQKYIPIALLGFTGVLSIYSIVVWLSTLANNQKNIAYGTFILLILCSYSTLFLTLIYSIRKQKIKGIIIYCCISILVIFGLNVFFEQQQYLFPSMIGSLETSPNYLSIINNNFYSSTWVNIELDTGASINSFINDCHLGFYYFVDCILKVFNKANFITNPISFSIDILQSILFYFYVEVLVVSLYKVKNERKYDLFVSSVFMLCFNLNFSTLNYGFISYLYLPQIVGIILYSHVNLNNSKPSNIVVLLLALSLISITTLGYILFAIIIVILILTIIIKRMNYRIAKAIVLFSLLCWLIYIFLSVTNVFDGSIILQHYAFSYYQEYLDKMSNKLVISVIVYCVTLYFVYFKQNKLLTLILIVMNPFIIYEFMNNLEHGFLVLELLLNFGVFFVLSQSILEIIPVSRKYTFVSLSCVLTLFVVQNKAEDTYQVQNNLSMDLYMEYNTELRILNSQVDIFNQLNLLTRYQDKRVKVISQLQFTNAFVSNIDLLYSNKYILGLCQYCDVETMGLHEPNELTNIFSYREYADNRLYIEFPQYQSACSLLKDNNYQYLILDNTQFYNDGTNYYPLQYAISNCSSVVYSNDQYTLLQVE